MKGVPLRRLRLAVPTLALLLHASGAVADQGSREDAPPATTSGACQHLDTGEVERLLRIELAVLAARADRVRAPRVELACAAGRIRITVIDTRSKTRLERILPAPKPDQPGRERMLAIAASQLFLSSWLEIVVSEPRREPSPGPATGESSGSSERHEQASLAFEMGLHGGVRWRGLRNSWLGKQLTLLARGIVRDRWWLVALASGETGAAERRNGRVQATLYAAGLSTGLRLELTDWLAADMGAGLRALFVTARGETSRADVVARRATGTALEPFLSVRPVISSGYLRVALLPEVGFAFPQLRAEVEGDSAVELSGPWFGVSVELGAEL